MNSWTCKHVVEWLQTLDLSPAPKDVSKVLMKIWGYVDFTWAFLQNWVDGPLLLELTPEDFTSSLKFTGVQTKRIVREINKLKGATPKPTQRKKDLRSTKGKDVYPLISSHSKLKLRIQNRVLGRMVWLQFNCEKRAHLHGRFHGSQCDRWLRHWFGWGFLNPRNLQWYGLNHKLG